MGPGNVFVGDTVDRGPWILYDRLTTAANTATPTSYQFFAVPIGGTKTKVDTNLLQGNRIAPPSAFHLHAIGFAIGPQMAFVDVWQLLRNYYFELKIGQKVFAEGPLHCFPAGTGLSGIIALDGSTAATRAESFNNGLPSPVYMRRFGPEFIRTIPANVYFGVEVRGNSFTTSASGQGIDLMVILDGIADREVQ